jgi:hypothetical protein
MMSVTLVPWTPPFVQSCTCSLRIIDQGSSQASPWYKKVEMARGLSPDRITRLIGATESLQGNHHPLYTEGLSQRCLLAVALGA